MKKRAFIEATVFLAIVIGILMGLTKITTNSGDYRNYQWIRGFYAEKENSLDAVIIGGSSAYAYWCAPIAWKNYGITVYPYANNSQPIEAAEYIIKESRKTQPNALYIVVINNLYFDYSEAAIHFVLDFLPNSIEKYQLAKVLLDNGGYAPEDRLEFYFPLFRYHSRWNELTKNDFSYEINGLKGGSIYKGYLEVSNDISAYYNNTNNKAEIDERIECALENLMDYCETEKVNVLFVTEPLAQHDEIIVAEYNTMNAMIKERGFPTLNLMDDMENVGLDLKKDYYNNHHVNIHGSVKTTNYLSEYLVENYNFVDKRGDSDYNDWNEAYDKYLNIVSPYALDFEYAGTQRDNALVAPELAKITADGGNQITLTWKAVNGADGYCIYRKEDNLGWQPIAAVDANTRTYVDASCKVKHKYTYTVASYSEREGEIYWGSYDFTGLSVIAVLSAPEMLEISDQSTVSWSEVKGADGYQVYHRVFGQPWALIADVSETTFRDNEQLAGVPYQYRVRAYYLNDAGGKVTGLYSYYLWLPELARPILSIQDLNGVPTLTWSAQEGITNYTIFRKSDGQEWKQLADPIASTYTQFRDITAEEGVAYEYQVTANLIYGSDTYSYPSDPVSAVAKAKPISLEMPNVLFCEQVGNAVQLVWEPTEKATAYRVYRRSAETDEWTVVKSAIAGNTYSEKPPKAGIYYYAIQSLYSVNNCTYYGIFRDIAEGTDVVFS